MPGAQVAQTSLARSQRCPDSRLSRLERRVQTASPQLPPHGQGRVGP